jgi:phosphate starvation-inducible PhoH-like protein
MSQVDLPHRQRSGLSYALDVLKDVEGIGIVRLGQSDIIRHSLVKKIVDAFEIAEAEEKAKKADVSTGSTTKNESSKK